MGRNTKDFRIFKFRSMKVGADKGSLVTIGGHDPRVTRSGYFIRKFKIDELPQLINVFIGDMSLVGPRPEVSHYEITGPLNKCMCLTCVPELRTLPLLSSETKMNLWRRQKTLRSITLK